jgi:hypothetical protein
MIGNRAARVAQFIEIIATEEHFSSKSPGRGMETADESSSVTSIERARDLALPFSLFK